MEAQIGNANFPMDADKRTYHLSTAAGQVANRILTVGDPARLRRLTSFLDPPLFEKVSHRGFTTVTGRYKGVPVSLVAIGMGAPMIDFLVRESRAVIEGDMVIIRFGSCGSLDPTLKCGSIGVPEASLMISTDYDHVPDDRSTSGYHTSKPIRADVALHKVLLESLRDTVASSKCEVRNIKLHASADCFYSSQGRQDSQFNDDNEQLVDNLLERYPDCKSLEMETAHLFHLARIAAREGSIKVAAAHMVFANRSAAPGDDGFISPQLVESTEPLVGQACLDALVAFDIPEANLHPTFGSAWDLRQPLDL